MQNAKDSIKLSYTAPKNRAVVCDLSAKTERRNRLTYKYLQMGNAGA